ncbi:MAG: type II toxin-antitoxin system HipA family toxin [Opitutales bacterium]
MNAEVRLWGTTIGAVSWLENRGYGEFQYAPEFVESGIQLSPLRMPLSDEVYSFADLPRDAFKGLPGLLADSLPDRFGNAVIDTWLAAQNRDPDSFNPVERLCYTGSRGMGGLEFIPAIYLRNEKSETESSANIEKLIGLANRVLSERSGLAGQVDCAVEGDEDLHDLLQLGTSAGGARAKAVMAWNPETGEFRSGQINHGAPFEHWLMKFDGVSGSGDHGLADPQGYGRVEYAYYLMADRAGVDMNPCRLHEEGGRAHFMTKRFDRIENGDKLHMLSLGGMDHLSYNMPEAYSYELAVIVMKKLGCSLPEIAQFVRRAFFNIVARNQDDHVKNTAFLMDRSGQWKLSPAYDITFAVNKDNRWLKQHQLSLNDKRDGFVIDDLLLFAARAGLKKSVTLRILKEIQESVLCWSEFAEEAGVDPDKFGNIPGAFRIFQI